MRKLVSVGAALAAFASASPVEAQVADYYRGTVVNAQLRDRPATLEFSVFERSDSTTTGWLKVGPPLGGSGIAAVLEQDLDSLYLYSTSQTGDTIVWASATRTGSIGGSYWINGGPYTGQGGTWQLEPQPRIPVATLVLAALFIAVSVLLMIYAVAVYSCDRWWKWQEGRPVRITDAQLRDWRSIGGWLAWIVVTSCILVVYMLARVTEIGDSFGSTWMLGAVIPSIKPVLLIESAAHLLQVLGVGLGVVLIIRRSALAPPYWIALLVAMACYAVYDLGATEAFRLRFNNVFGAEASAEFAREAQEAVTQNTRMVLSAAIWSLYWLRSRRVRVAFAPSMARFDNTAPSPAVRVEFAALRSSQQVPEDVNDS